MSRGAGHDAEPPPATRAEARARRQAEGPRLRVDPVACQGVGMCAHLAPGLIALDPWGYPVLPEGPLHRRDERAARVATGGCPKKALFIT